MQSDKSDKSVEFTFMVSVADLGFPRRGRQPLILEREPTIWQDFG